jgi:hypothetical protein
MGAILDVAIAWGCTLRWRSLDLEVADNLEPGSTDAQWLKKFKWPEPDSSTFIAHKRSSTFGWVDDQYTISFKPYDPSRTAGLWRTRCGWPFLSLQGISRSGNYTEMGFVESQTGFIYVDGNVVGTPNVGWYFPTSPLGLGFALNTIFYAAILWLLFAAPGRIRRWRRIARGRCPHCGYPVGASSVCTECGKPTPSPSGRGQG